MIENRGTSTPAQARLRCHRALPQVFSCATIVATVLLVGCGVSTAPESAKVSCGSVGAIQLVSGAQELGGGRVAGLIPYHGSPCRPGDSPAVEKRSVEATSLPNREGLPPLDVAMGPNDPDEDTPAEPAEPIGVLLPPQRVDVELHRLPQPMEEEHATSDPVTPTRERLSDQERLLVEQVIRDCSEASTGVSTDTRLDEMAREKICQANALASRGAQYAARQKLIEVLRMISQAKDAEQGDRRFSAALAAGLRALDEAEDFAPRGTQLEGELELDLITAAHRTPIARQEDSSRMLPRHMMDLYFRYAQLKLAMSVAEEPAGSMALYALGKVTSQMGVTEPERHRLAHRRAVAFQQAALLAHDQNHLAAHELAVLLAESGHFAEAQNLLLQVAAGQPNATVYENLAQVQQRMGLAEQAELGRSIAAQLASQGAVGGAGSIQWVAPEAFIRAGGEPAQVAPTPGDGSLPLTRRPQHSRRTAMTRQSPATPQTAFPPPQQDWR